MRKPTTRKYIKADFQKLLSNRLLDLPFKTRYVDRFNDGPAMFPSHSPNNFYPCRKIGHVV